MPLGIIKRDPVKLNEFPTPIPKKEGQGAITNGDLHANSLRLIHCLLTHDAIGFKPNINAKESYQKFVALYDATEAHLNDSTGQPIIIYYEEGKEPRELTYRDDKRENQLCISSNYLQMYSKKLNLESEIGRTNKILANSDIKDSYRETTITQNNTAQIELAAINEHLQAFETNTERRQAFQEILDNFKTFLSTLEVKDPALLLRLIGDELADRGCNDWFTLEILKFLKANDAPVTILLSNHGGQFVQDYEKSGPAIVPRFTDKPSLYGLKYMLNAGFLKQTELDDLIGNTYKPMLKLLDYELTEDGIQIFTHAPIVFDYIKYVATQLHVVYNDATAVELATTIDKINTQFQQYVQNNEVGKLLNTEYSGRDMKEDFKLNDKNPVHHLINTRLKDNGHNYNSSNTNQGGDLADETLRPRTKNGYALHLVNGHDNTQSAISTHHITLDSFFGKYSDTNPMKTIAQQERPETKFDEYLVLASTNRRLEPRYTPKEIEDEYQKAQQPPATAIPQRTPLQAAIRVGAATALSLAGASAAVIVPLLLLTSFAPPLALGVLAFGLAVAGLCLLAGVIAGGIAARAQQKANLKPAAIASEPVTKTETIEPRRSSTANIDSQLRAAAGHQKTPAPAKAEGIASAPAPATTTTTETRTANSDTDTVKNADDNRPPSSPGPG